MADHRGNSIHLEPYIDMEFESHEAAYSFYKEYAKSAGFGTAKLSSRRSRASKEFIDAKFSCIRYGNKQQSDDAINPRPSPKIGCKASMHVKRRPNGKWYVYTFIKEHNHELLPDQVHFFRSHRSADPVKVDVRARKRKNLTAVSKLFSAYQNIDGLESCMGNQQDRGRSLVLEAGDAQVLLELFTLMQEQNPEFFYAIDLNEDHQLRNVFWVDAKGIEDYKSFGDVVSFDTTYLTNKYKIPLVLFLGVNHHIQPTLLGCALIADETVHTFVWLMQTWALAMGERAPQVMLTDQNNALKVAISAIFPKTVHCFCLWHVLERLPQSLEYTNLWHDGFMKKFYKCIYNSWTEEQFEKRWWKLLDKFHFRDVQWIRSLYDDRKHWVPTFLKNISFAGLSAASRSESLNPWFDKYVTTETSLREFIERYRVILEDRCEEEAKADFDAWHETPELKSPSPFEKQISLVYTHEIFKRFQVEVLGAAACHLKEECERDTTTVYSVKDFEDNQNYMVEWNNANSDIYCSCRSFEYKGYICRHAIVVFQMSGMFSIPSKYILKRWTNAARSRHAISERTEEVQSKVHRFNDLCRRAIILGEEGSLSQESYEMAVLAIKEALKQCAASNNSLEDHAGLDNSSIISEILAGEENQCNTSYSEQVPVSNPSCANTIPGKADESNEKIVTKRGKGIQSGVIVDRSQAGFSMQELSDPRALQLNNMIPGQFHSMMPVMFHNVAPTQFQGAASAHLPHNNPPH